MSQENINDIIAEDNERYGSGGHYADERDAPDYVDGSGREQDSEVDYLITIIAQMRHALVLGNKPMLSELPQRCADLVAASQEREKQLVEALEIAVMRQGFSNEELIDARRLLAAKPTGD